jgi:uncharacterized protein
MNMIFPYPLMLLILCPLIFLAGFIDSIAGGGGLISLPSYMLAGIPIHVCYGTNKFVSGCGTATASINYFRNRCVNVRVAVPGSVGSLIGAAAGAHLALMLSPAALQFCLLVILPVVAVFMVFNRNFGTIKPGPALPSGILMAGAFVTGLVIGCYDGFFGPGAGMFFTLVLTVCLRLNLVMASGTTKVINLASNIASAVTFIIAGKVMYTIAIPCLFCSISGNFLGSRLAIKNGARFIRPLIAAVSVLLFARTGYNFFVCR